MFGHHQYLVSCNELSQQPKKNYRKYSFHKTPWLSMDPKECTWSLFFPSVAKCWSPFLVGTHECRVAFPWDVLEQPLPREPWRLDEVQLLQFCPLDCADLPPISEEDFVHIQITKEVTGPMQSSYFHWMLIIDKLLIHIYMFECHLYSECIWHRNLMAISTLNICCFKACRPRSNPHSLSNRFVFTLGKYGSLLPEISIGYAFARNQGSELQVLKVNAPHQKKDKPFILWNILTQVVTNTIYS